MLEILDEKHCKINAYLIDIPRIEHWVFSKSWAPHNPIQAFYRLRSLLKDLADGAKWNETVEYRLIRDLMRINNYGFYIPDEVFSTTPGLYRHKSTSIVTYWSVKTGVSEIREAKYYPLWEPNGN